MNHVWLPSEAKSADSVAIASLFALSWTSPFTRLQFGHVDPLTLTAAMAPRIVQQMKMPNVAFVVIRDPGTQEIVSVAQWTLPGDESDAMEETQEEQDERQMFDDELYRINLPNNSNKDLIMEFTIGLRVLKRRVLQGQKHYLLENLATHPDYRGKGLASRLVEWVFPQADSENALVYLDTASDNPAVRMYQRLGFQEQDHHTIDNLSHVVGRQDLQKHGGSLEHRHIALVRYP